MVNQIGISKDIFDFMKGQNDKIQEDPDKALKEFADHIAKVITQAIQSADITIFPGLINVVGVTGPSVNTIPIFLKKSIK